MLKEYLWDVKVKGEMLESDLKVPLTTGFKVYKNMLL